MSLSCSAMSAELDVKAVVAALNRIMESELSGVVRYTHYSLMVFGVDRIPLVDYLRAQATESLAHAEQAGEMVTHLGEHPSLAIGPLLETHKHDRVDVLREAFDHERQALALYQRLLKLVEGKSVMLEEYARSMVRAEEEHVGQMDKMLRSPGEIASFAG